ncbi:MAG: hypothetical protein J7623_27815 [Chitinophaga sp.]|uniref:hypothetical protein n=1 Tax=Chitinophaga sp. TaxID=1869181 RepID=UPI001B10F7DC|nr:hypothetical protein [Chitinophaga sp.]MBO9732481.1 hypothetical protein [Chitinophaga sp.]
MWSNLYLYYEIRGSSDYSQQLHTDMVLKVLENTGVLVKVAPRQFCNIDTFPWMNITAIYTKDGNYGRPESFNSKWVTMLAITASKSDPELEAVYVQLLSDIAAKLHWELILEMDDEGNEDVILYKS